MQIKKNIYSSFEYFNNDYDQKSKISFYNLQLQYYNFNHY